MTTTGRTTPEQYESLHLMVARTVRARQSDLGGRVAAGLLLSDLPPYARRTVSHVLSTAEPCDHLAAAGRDAVADPAYAFADESDSLLCGGCMRLRAEERVRSADDGSGCDVCGAAGSTYVVVAGILVVTGSLCAGCAVLWDVPLQDRRI